MKTENRNFLTGLMLGICQPSLSTFFLTIFTLLSLLFTCFFINPATLRLIPEEFLMLDPYDRDVIISQKTNQINKTHPESTSVTLIGASSLEDALLDESEIRKQLNERVKAEINVFKITAPGMRTWDVASILDSIPDSYKGIVVVCISMGYDPYEVLNRRKSRSRFAISSPSYREEMEAFGYELPNTTGIFFIDNLHFFSKRSKAIIRSLIFGPVTPKFRWEEKKALSRESKNKSVNYVKKRAKEKAQHYLKYSSINYDSLARVIRRLKSQKLKIFYLQPPRNDELLEPVYNSMHVKKLMSKIQSDAESFTKKNGISYINLQKAAQLSFTDFIDDAHLCKLQARQMFTQLLVERMAQKLNKANQ